jgi:non-canonical poly(A) RNA polymerase PAPD5/7
MQKIRCRCSKITTLTAPRVVVVASGLMQLSQTRLTCRAHNRFNPSTALWQHFVQASPANPRDRRQLSTATKAAPDDANASTKDAQSESASPPEARHAHDIEVTTGKTAERPSAEPSPWQLRKMTTVKGRWLPTKAESSIAKNIHLQNINTEAESESQLQIARDAFAKSKDYKGVVVRPVVSGEPIKESELPWCTNKEDGETISGFNRYISNPALTFALSC